MQPGPVARRVTGYPRGTGHSRAQGFRKHGSRGVPMRNALPTVAAVSALLLAATLGAALPVGGTPARVPAPGASAGLPFDAAVADALRHACAGSRVQVELSPGAV